jgi:hypothetical protein
MLRSLRATLLLLLAAVGASAQQPGRTAVLAGYGGIDHEGSLGPAFHLNLRRALLGRDSLVVYDLNPRERLVLQRIELQAEAFGQAGEGGTRLAACRSDPGEQCISGADPVYLLGAGLVGRWDATPARSPVQLYLLPLTTGVYLRGYTVHERPLGSARVRTEERVRLGAGFGNGLGLRLRLAGVSALAELRAVLVRDLEGGRGGSIPVSVGLAW